MIHEKFARRPFERSINHFVDDLFNELPVLFKNESSTTTSKKWAPANITETDNSYKVDLVAPGFNKEDFKIKLEQNILTIEAESKEAVKNETEKEIRKEFSFRSIKRAFTVDEKIDTTNIDAQFVNGVLTLTLPKKEKVAPAAQEIAIR